MNAGDTFYVNRTADEHLWVILSDVSLNAGQILLASFTTWMDYKDPSCIVHASEHAGLRHRSCIAYDFARVVSLEQLQILERAGQLLPQSPVSSDLLKRIREGAARSERLRPAFRQILIDQGLIL